MLRSIKPNRFKHSLIFFVPLLACDTYPGSVELRFQVTDLNAIREPGEGRAELSIELAQQSTDKEALDYTKAVTSDSEGIAMARVTQNQIHALSPTTGESALYGPTAWFKAEAEDIDFIDLPIPMPARDFGVLDYCPDVLGVATNTESEQSLQSWIRIYKRSGPFSTTDVLTIVAQENATSIRNGENLISAPVVFGEPQFIDIYDDQSQTEDRYAHIDAEVLSNAFEEPEAKYSISLNGDTIDIALGPCSEGKFAVVYLDEP